MTCALIMQKFRHQVARPVWINASPVSDESPIPRFQVPAVASRRQDGANNLQVRDAQCGLYSGANNNACESRFSGVNTPPVPYSASTRKMNRF